MNELIKFFEPSMWPLFLLGFFTFFSTLLENWLNPKKRMKKFSWYVLEFIYTLISIVLGISVCFAMETKLSTCYVVAIVMGLIGPTLIRKIQSKKENICDEIIDTATEKVKDKIENN